VADLYECFALVGIFYYIITAVTPDESKRLLFFQELENKDKNGNVIPGGSLAWFYQRWLLVFQILPIRIITTIATWIIVATYCPTAHKKRTATLIINIVNSVSTVFCVMAILRSYGRLKGYLQGHHIVFKLVTLKLVIGLELLQRAVFSGLTQHGVLKQATHISYMDWTVGIPQFLTVCEMFLFSWSFIFAYTWKPYKLGNDLAVEKHSFFKGVFDAWNITDILYGALYTLKLRSLVNQTKGESLPAYGQSEYPKETENAPQSGYPQQGQQQYGRV